MSSLGSSERATPSTTTMVFCSSSSSGRVRMSNRPVTSNSSVSSFAIEMSSAVRLWIGSPMARIACAKLFDRMMPRHIAGVEMHLRRALIVAGDEAEQDFGEEAPLLRPEPSHDAEVDRDQPAVVVDEQIAGMHVGVEEAVAQAHGAGSSGSPLRPSAGRSKPLAASAARSLSGVPSIHSSVSTSRAVRSQSTAGTRKAGSSLVFSAISESAAASSRKSISIAHRARQRRHHFDRGAAAALRADRLSAVRAAKKKASRSDWKRRSMPGRRTFTATGLRSPSVVDLGAMHLRDRGGGDRRAEARHRPR